MSAFYLLKEISWEGNTEFKAMQSCSYVPVNVMYFDTAESGIVHIGQLQRITNLIRNAGPLSWEPPFSLDLTSVDSDIVYSVEVII